MGKKLPMLINQGMPNTFTRNKERLCPYTDNTGYQVDVPCPECNSYWRRNGECNLCQKQTHVNTKIAGIEKPD